ncbi:hypothetical protein SAMN05880570_3704 [Paenibacillus sp. RU4T]|nr:hypothetical protein SAMN05880555_3702 [Paenibacillus sp. RU4X]SIR51336.1 hypothetical protein SAMN05880570_3704 [Paenibacillus sp. RU4T]
MLQEPKKGTEQKNAPKEGRAARSRDSSALSFVPESCLASRSASFPLGDSMRACARAWNSLQRCVRQRSFCLRDSPCPQGLLLRRRPVLQVVSPAAFIRSIQLRISSRLQTLSTPIICRSAAIFNPQSAGRSAGRSNYAKRRSCRCTRRDRSVRLTRPDLRAGCVFLPIGAGAGTDWRGSRQIGRGLLLGGVRGRLTGACTKVPVCSDYR